ncbi:hypothetical protein BT67DRAFT_137109 [Trichocladium antarcticum]|uniref:Uncharacterized protein n=1 Tax=Trichocladium antarcticum TaxID=1450529 RepID=A0AAN6UFP5_9PEZI|nr:hypothetical protein BT67DRAFT_137109 [Trichocladium antarcticum]
MAQANRSNPRGSCTPVSLVNRNRPIPSLNDRRDAVCCGAGDLSCLGGVRTCSATCCGCHWLVPRGWPGTGVCDLTTMQRMGALNLPSDTALRGQRLLCKFCGGRPLPGLCLSVSRRPPRPAFCMCSRLPLASGPARRPPKSQFVRATLTSCLIWIGSSATNIAREYEEPERAGDDGVPGYGLSPTCHRVSVLLVEDSHEQSCSRPSSSPASLFAGPQDDGSSPPSAGMLQGSAHSGDLKRAVGPCALRSVVLPKAMTGPVPI